MRIVRYCIMLVICTPVYPLHPSIPISEYFVKAVNMEARSINKTDSAELSKLNAQFIRNFLNQDAKAHAKIIHTNFICIESSGAITDRGTYLKNWATDLDKSGYTSFTYSEESIRIFENVALVRSKTTYTKNEGDKKTEGYTIYTDTYFKENGEWKCVQVQITPVK